MNDGMLLEHTGTCNDGVGKGACGGIAVIKSPGGGSKKSGENVLVGNFALFGASGGQFYVNGEAGDRFSVRNSGALAVVEGVGDFFCEYMTSGTVLNLGSFGKGFCNGMSGGNAYQYDPDSLLSKSYSEDSVILKSINDESEEALAHESIILTMLSQHASRTGSQIAKRILENWQTTKQHFKYATPLALYKTQTVEGILKSMDERMIVEELSFAVAKEELATVADAYKAGNALLNGDFPKYGQIDTPEMFKLINCYSHLAKAVDMARVQLKQSGPVNPNPQVDGLARSLIVNQDRKLLETIAKDVKTALQPFSAEELASKLMRKRINDYKTSMQERDIQDNNSLGTTAWILQQERHNVGVSQSYLKFEEHYAGKSIDKLL
jgi:glutamate synthase (NADPH/NADH) large chain